MIKGCHVMIHWQLQIVESQPVDVVNIKKVQNQDPLHKWMHTTLISLPLQSEIQGGISSIHITGELRTRKLAKLQAQDPQFHVTAEMAALRLTQAPQGKLSISSNCPVEWLHKYIPVSPSLQSNLPVVRESDMKQKIFFVTMYRAVTSLILARFIYYRLDSHIFLSL